jgi:uncharacterized protein HemY
MGEMARTLVLIGAVLIVVGLVMLAVPRLPFLGKLPGDILIKKNNFTLYFPLATSVVISIIISLVLYFINKLK